MKLLTRKGIEYCENHVQQCQNWRTLLNFLKNNCLQWCFLVRAAEDEAWCLRSPEVQRWTQKQVLTSPQLFSGLTALRALQFTCNSLSNCKISECAKIAWKYLTSESGVRQKWTADPPCENIADLRGRTLSWCAHRSGHMPSSLRRHHLHMVQCKHWLGRVGLNK